jgi:hypothetical protein
MSGAALFGLGQFSSWSRPAPPERS